MSFRNATLATAVMLGLGLNASGIQNALAGEGCARMAAAGGNQAYNHSSMARPDAYRYSRSPYAAPAMHPMAVQPAMYWGSEPPRLIKTGTMETAAAPAGDLVDVAVAAGNFETLVAAVKAAELAETLTGEGPYTVFAPTDEAFAKIPQDKLDALLADKDALTVVLTYHVVPGKLMAADVVELNSATTVQGSTISIDTSDGVKVNGANVIATDIEASNGVIHVIDTVLMPE